MRWLRLYLRCRRVPHALAVSASVAVAARLVPADVRLAALSVMLAAAAFGSTLGAPDEALERTAAVRWPVRRACHVAAMALTLAVVAGSRFGPLAVVVRDAGFGPLAVVARDAAGLAGLAALGAALVGAANAWIAPLLWTLVAVLPLVGPSGDVRVQLAAWPIQPAGTPAAAVCAGALAVLGLAAYSWRGARE